MKETMISYISSTIQRACARLDSDDVKERYRARRYLRRIMPNIEDIINTDGGAGSGNWGHVGRPGVRGGSGSGGGKQYRLSTPGGGYTSQSKANAENKSYDRKWKDLNKRMKATRKDLSAREADDILRETSGKVWRSLNKDEKSSLEKYTGAGYFSINKGLRAGGQLDDYAKDKINNITKAIDKAEIPQDMWMSRGTGMGGAASFLGVSEDDLTPENLPNLIGRKCSDDGFLSCGSTEGKGMTYKPVQFSVFVPKGTKGLYAEPFSLHGQGDGLSWDGKNKQKYFASEQETILQRGTQAKVMKATYDVVYDVINIEVCVTGQEYDEL